MRVVLVSKAFVNAAYQRKCELMAEADPDLVLTLISPPSWRWGSRVSFFRPIHTRGYAARVLPIAFNGSFHLHWYRGLRRALREARPDLVHLDEEPYNLATWLGLRDARALGARSVFFTWQNLRRDYPPPFRWFERAVMRTCTVALAGSADAGAVLRGKGYTGDVRVVPQFGVDEAFFTPGPHPHADGFVVGYAGRLDPEKGVDTLLGALATVPGAVLRLAGDGPERPRLAALAADLGVADRVGFLGTLDTPELLAFYRGLDALVLPSRARPNWVEQFGRVLIEAMACGVPVVGSRTGEIPAVIGDAGVLFGEGDVDGLAAALRALRASPAEARELGARGRRRALERFTMRRVAADTVAAYRAALA